VARLCAALFVLAAMVLPAAGQDAAIAGVQGQELKASLQNVLSAIKAGDTKTAEKSVEGFKLPHAKEWFTRTFGAQEAPAMEKVFAKLEPDAKKSVMEQLSFDVKNGKMDVDVRASDAVTGADARLLKAAAAAMKTPTAIYAVRIGNGPNDAGATRPGFFVYADGGFRYLNGQVLYALSTAPPMRVVIGGNVLAARIVSRVEPKYPAEARAQGIQGAVDLHVDGAVLEATPTSGDAALVQAAVDAVKQWRYQPTLLNGKAVEVDTRVVVTFSLKP
jgi:TonB family protein